MNYAQGFFMGLGIEQEQRFLLAQAEKEIEAVNRLRRHALKIRNFGIVQDCDADLRGLRETLNGLRSSLGMPQASYACPAGTKSMSGERSSNGGNLEPAEAQDCGTLHLVGTEAAHSKQNFPSHEGQGGNQQTNNV